MQTWCNQSIVWTELCKYGINKDIIKYILYCFLLFFTKFFNKFVKDLLWRPDQTNNNYLNHFKAVSVLIQNHSAKLRTYLLFTTLSWSLLNLVPFISYLGPGCSLYYPSHRWQRSTYFAERFSSGVITSQATVKLGMGAKTYF